MESKNQKKWTIIHRSLTKFPNKNRSSRKSQFCRKKIKKMVIRLRKLLKGGKNISDLDIMDYMFLNRRLLNKRAQRRNSKLNQNYSIFQR